MPLILAATIADAWKLGSFLCTVSGMCNSLFCITSVLTLAAVSWDRYLVIIHPLNYEELMTDRKVKFIIGKVVCSMTFKSSFAMPTSRTNYRIFNLKFQDPKTWNSIDEILWHQSIPKATQEFQYQPILNNINLFITFTNIIHLPC